MKLTTSFLLAAIISLMPGVLPTAFAAPTTGTEILDIAAPRVDSTG